MNILKYLLITCCSGLITFLLTITLISDKEKSEKFNSLSEKCFKIARFLKTNARIEKEQDQYLCVFDLKFNDGLSKFIMEDEIYPVYRFLNNIYEKNNW